MLRLRAGSATVDGEAVVCDGRGVTNFDALRSALARRQGRSGVFLYAFDLLELDTREGQESGRARSATDRRDRVVASPCVN